MMVGEEIFSDNYNFGIRNPQGASEPTFRVSDIFQR